MERANSTVSAGPSKPFPSVWKAAGARYLFCRRGFRRGTDIFKALALGATAVGIGRPYLWGLALGESGVERVIALLRAELALDMGMAGIANISQINRSYVRVRQ